MAWSTATLADAYRRGVIDGLVSRATVCEWLDSLIQMADDPGIEIIEASMAATASVADLVSALDELQAGSDTALAVRGYFHLAALSLERDESVLRAITKSLEGMAQDGESPDDEAESRMWAFDDERLLAKRGIVDTVEGIRQDVLAFLRKYERWPEA